MSTRIYDIVDNCTGNSIGIVSRYNVKAVLCDEYDTCQDGVIQAIEDIENHIAGVANSAEWGCEFLNCSYAEVELCDVHTLALIEVLLGARIKRTDMAGHPMELVGFSAGCVKALQAVYCGWDACGQHYIESVGMDDAEAALMNDLFSRQCKSC